MNLLPRGRAGTGHRRAHSSALEICSTTFEEQELKGTQPLLEEKSISVPTQKPRIDTLFIVLWVISVVLTAICTYFWTSRSSGIELGGFATGFLTELGMYFQTQLLLVCRHSNQRLKLLLSQPSKFVQRNSMGVLISMAIMVSCLLGLQVLNTSDQPLR